MKLLIWTVVPVASYGMIMNPRGAKTATIPKTCKILILPGFGNDSIDYTANGQAGVDGSLVASLQKRGWNENQIDILPVERFDWLQVFLRGALDLKFWQSEAPPTRPAFRWYLDRVAAKVEELDDDETIVLLGHSAGGWLARAAVGFGTTDEEDTPQIDLSKIAGIVTLGAPNLPPPPGVMDMTRGALRITNEQFPGAFHAPSLFYLTVAGDAIRGKKQERKSPQEPNSLAGFAFNSYEAVCGDGNVGGDGVVPLCAAHVENSVQLTLDGVFHSINAPRNWYGSDAILDQWHDTFLEELTRKDEVPMVESLGKMFQ